MDVHYCMGKLSGVEFYQTKSNEKCRLCGMTEKKGGCCNDEHRFYKIQDSHNSTSKLIHEIHFSNIIVSKNCFQFIPKIEIVKEPSLKSIVSPVISSPPIYIKNCVFRL